MPVHFWPFRAVPCNVLHSNSVTESKSRQAKVRAHSLASADLDVNDQSYQIKISFFLLLSDGQAFEPFRLVLLLINKEECDSPSLILLIANRYLDDEIRRISFRKHSDGGQWAIVMLYHGGFDEKFS